MSSLLSQVKLEAFLKAKFCEFIKGEGDGLNLSFMINEWNLLLLLLLIFFIKSWIQLSLARGFKPDRGFG